jgi:hypothetical protein
MKSGEEVASAERRHDSIGDRRITIYIWFATVLITAFTYSISSDQSSVHLTKQQHDILPKPFPKGAATGFGDDVALIGKRRNVHSR